MNPPVVTEQERTQKELAVVGKGLPKADAGVKVTGQAQYIHDFQMPGMLYGKVRKSWAKMHALKWYRKMVKD